MAKRKPPSRGQSSALAFPSHELIADLSQLIEAAKTRVAETANSVLTLLHWHVGTRIRSELLQGVTGRFKTGHGGALQNRPGNG